MAQNNHQTTKWVIKLPLQMPRIPMKAIIVKCVFLGPEVFKKIARSQCFQLPVPPHIIYFQRP